jgi:hypothetical protein
VSSRHLEGDGELSVTGRDRQLQPIGGQLPPDEDRQLLDGSLTITGRHADIGQHRHRPCLRRRIQPGPAPDHDAVDLELELRRPEPGRCRRDRHDRRLVDVLQGERFLAARGPHQDEVDGPVGNPLLLAGHCLGGQTKHASVRKRPAHEQVHVVELPTHVEHAHPEDAGVEVVVAGGGERNGGQIAHLLKARPSVVTDEMPTIPSSSRRT